MLVLLYLIIDMNKLFYGDNLFILREHIATESVDLIYLDPPFNSSRNYNYELNQQLSNYSTASRTYFDPRSSKQSLFTLSLIIRIIDKCAKIGNDREDIVM